MGQALFADTAFYIALLWPRDPYHARALAWRDYFLANGLSLLTTEAVLWELLNAFAGPPTRRLAFQAYESVHGDPQIEVVGVEAPLMRQALDLYAARSDKGWGITDCLSFVVMWERGLTDALTTDHHFDQAGFPALLLRDPPP